MDFWLKRSRRDPSAQEPSVFPFLSRHTIRAHEGRQLVDLRPYVLSFERLGALVRQTRDRRGASELNGKPKHELHGPMKEKPPTEDQWISILGPPTTDQTMVLSEPGVVFLGSQAGHVTGQTTRGPSGRPKNGTSAIASRFVCQWTTSEPARHPSGECGKVVGSGVLTCQLVTPASWPKHQTKYNKHQSPLRGG